MRCLVEISQAEAALTKTSFAASAMASRALTESAASPPSHQRKAWVSSNSRKPLFPPRQFFFGQGFEKLGSDGHDALERTEFSLGRLRNVRREFGDRSLAAGQNDFLARFYAGEQFGEIGLSRVNGDSGHGVLIS